MTPNPRPRSSTADLSPIRLADSPGPAEPSEPMAGARSTRPSLPAGLEPMVTTEDFVALLRCNRRTFERLRSAGKLPRPDIQLGRMPRWRAQTIREWIERGEC
jgi:predicted DNA-binding transcriptional regulator AlpA